MHSRLFILFLFSACAMVHVQGATTRKQADAKADSIVDAAGNAVPNYTLDFKKIDPVPGVPASGAWITPVQCDTDGAMFLAFMKSVDPGTKLDAPPHQIYYSMGVKEGHTFDPFRVPGLYDSAVISWFPSNSAVAFLIDATKESKLTERTHPGANGAVSNAMVNLGKRHTYIAEFDKSGSYQKLIELPMDYQIYRFALLDSGQFVISGYDRLNNVPRLLLLDSDGSVLRPIPLPQSIQNYDASKESTPWAAMMGAMENFGSIEFTSYAGGVLIWRRGNTDPVIEVGIDGAVRELSVEYPKGFVLSDFVPSSKRLIAHVQPANQPKEGAHDLHTYRYFEVRPSDGTLERQFRFGSNLTRTITCESDGTFFSEEMGAGGALRRLVAN